MITEEQGKATAQALLDQPLREQRERAERIPLAKTQRFPPTKWLAIGALSGLIIGGALGYIISGEVNPWSIFGLSAGIAAGVGFDRRREA